MCEYVFVCLLIASAFTLLLLAVGSMSRILWCLMLACEKSQPLREHCPGE